MGNTKETTEVGIIGQMYEERKSGKIGVLESREPKYKTLMMRDKDGKSFNITFSTFRSNWRKYAGDEVIQTSTQVEEKREEEKKEKVEATKTVKEKTEEVKVSTEDKVKRLRALSTVVEDAIKEKGIDLKVDRSSRGNLNIRYKKTSLIQIWDVIKLEKYSFRLKESVDQYISTQAEREFFEKHSLKVRYRVNTSDFDTMLSEVLDAAEKWIEIKIQEDKKKNEKNEEKEKE